MPLFESFNSIHEAFSAAPGSGSQPRNNRPRRRRKTIGQVLAFYALNMIVLPLVVLCYLTVGAEGLRQTMDVFQTRFYRLAIPGASYLRDLDGWDKLDLALPMALVLFIALGLLWKKVFTFLQDGSLITKQKQENPVLFYLMVGIVLIVVLGDAGIFYAGLSSSVASSWNENAGYIPAVATVIYGAGLALLGAWHADYYKTESV